MSNPVTNVLSAGVRQKVYVTYAVLGICIGATQVGFASANAGQPTWLTVTLAVFAFLGGALGVTAASNVTPSLDATDASAASSSSG